MTRSFPPGCRTCYEVLPNTPLTRRSNTNKRPWSHGLPPHFSPLLLLCLSKAAESRRWAFPSLLQDPSPRPASRLPPMPGPPQMEGAKELSKCFQGAARKTLSREVETRHQELLAVYMTEYTRTEVAKTRHLGRFPSSEHQSSCSDHNLIRPQRSTWKKW